MPLTQATSATKVEMVGEGTINDDQAPILLRKATKGTVANTFMVGSYRKNDHTFDDSMTTLPMEHERPRCRVPHHFIVQAPWPLLGAKHLFEILLPSS